MKEGFPSSFYNLLHADDARVISILYILCYTAVKHYWLLGYYANLSSYERHIDCYRQATVNQLKIKRWH